MKKILLSTIFLFHLFFSNAQQWNFNWFRGMGGTGADVGKAIKADASGNVYTTGYFSGSAKFGSINLSSAGDVDCFISKIDALGNCVWSKRIGGTGSDVGYSLTLDASGNIYIIGWFTGSVDFDPGAGSANLIASGSNDVFVCKLDASGNFVWAKKMGGTSSDVANDISVDAIGNVYITGYFSGTADFDPAAGIANLASSGGSNDIFVCKLDASGNFVWAVKIGNSFNELGNSIKADGSGVYITGSFGGGTVDFDPGAGTANLTSQGGYDIFICKLDVSGNYVWAKSVGSGDEDRGMDIQVDASGNVFTTGYFRGTVDFDPGIGNYNLASKGSFDAFVSKLDASGNLVWAKSFGGATTEYSYSLELDKLGNIYTTGAFATTADFDPGSGVANLTATASNNVFVSKLDASGNYVWAKGMGGNDLSYSMSITVDPLDNVFILGYYSGYFYSNSYGANDIFAIKLGPCTTPMDVSTSLSGTTISANLESVGYKWLNCKTKTVIPGYWSQSFTATSNGSYAVIVSVGECADTSDCVDVYVTDVISTSLDNSTIIYPNPTKGDLTVELANGAEAIITDALGKIVYTKYLNEGKHSLFLTGEQNGIYFVKIKSSEGQIIKKIVLNR